MNEALQLTLFAEDFPAKTSLSPEKAQDLMASEAASGSSSTASSKKSTRSTRSSKTSAPFALEDWTQCSGHSLRSGMMRNGIVSPLPPLALLTAGTESGSWPTPRTKGLIGGSGSKQMMQNKISKGEISAEEASAMTCLKLWATPTCMDHLPPLVSKSYKESLEGRRKVSSNLRDQIFQMWPTPQASDHRDRGCMEDPSIQRRIKIGKQIGLSTAVKEHRGSGMLNPTWVEWLMGFPTGWTDLNNSETR